MQTPQDGDLKEAKASKGPHNGGPTNYFWLPVSR